MCTFVYISQLPVVIAQSPIPCIYRFIPPQHFRVHRTLRPAIGNTRFTQSPARTRNSPKPFL